MKRRLSTHVSQLLRMSLASESDFTRRVRSHAMPVLSPYSLHSVTEHVGTDAGFHGAVALTWGGGWECVGAPRHSLSFAGPV